jgi:hypothetical protein
VSFHSRPNTRQQQVLPLMEIETHSRERRERHPAPARELAATDTAVAFRRGHRETAHRSGQRIGRECLGRPSAERKEATGGGCVNGRFGGKAGGCGASLEGIFYPARRASSACRRIFRERTCRNKVSQFKNSTRTDRYKASINYTPS